MSAHEPGRESAARGGPIRATQRSCKRLLLAALLLPTALAACAREDATESAPGLTAEEFIEVVVALREAERAALEVDTAAEVFSRRKAEILERHGTTEQEIRAFLDAESADLERMMEMWEEISDRLRQPAPDDPEDPQ